MNDSSNTDNDKNLHRVSAEAQDQGLQSAVIKGKRNKDVRKNSTGTTTGKNLAGVGVRARRKNTLIAARNNNTIEGINATTTTTTSNLFSTAATQPLLPQFVSQEEQLIQQNLLLQKLQNLTQHQLGMQQQPLFCINPTQNLVGHHPPPPNPPLLPPPNPALLLQLLQFQQQQQQQQYQQPQPSIPQTAALHPQPDSMSLVEHLIQSALLGSQADSTVNNLLHQWRGQQPQQQQGQIQNVKQLETGQDRNTIARQGSQHKHPPTPKPPTKTANSGDGSSDASQQTPAITASSLDNSTNTHHHHRHHRRPRPIESTREDVSDDSLNKRTDTQTTMSSSDQGSSSSKVVSSSSRSSSNPSSDMALFPPPPPKIKNQLASAMSEYTSSTIEDNEEEEDEEEEDEAEAYDDSYEDDGGDEEEDDSDNNPGMADNNSRKEKMTSGTFKIPCRARGMAMDHNPLTAFFLIPSTIQHGEDVLCSHPACRKAGVKFRYCSFCGTPVAKRNFGRRHTHAGEEIPQNQGSGNNMSGEGATSVEATGVPKEKESGRKRQSLQSVENNDVQPAAKHPRIQQEKDPDIPKSIGNRRSDDSPSSGETDSTSGSGTDVQQENKTNGQGVFRNFDRCRQEVWIKLLNQRPDSNDNRAMSVWVRKVMVVSDTSQPLSRLDDISVSTEEEEEKQIAEKKVA